MARRIALLLAMVALFLISSASKRIQRVSTPGRFRVSVEAPPSVPRVGDPLVLFVVAVPVEALQEVALSVGQDGSSRAKLPMLGEDAFSRQMWLEGRQIPAMTTTPEWWAGQSLKAETLIHMRYSARVEESGPLTVEFRYAYRLPGGAIGYGREKVFEATIAAVRDTALSSKEELERKPISAPLNLSPVAPSRPHAAPEPELEHRGVRVDSLPRRSAAATDSSRVQPW